MRSETGVAGGVERQVSLRRKSTKAGSIYAWLASTDFARVVGDDPALEPVGMEVAETLKAVCETFGPPERRNSTVYWNFISRHDHFDGPLSPAGSRKEGVLTFKLAAAGNAESLQQWMFDRLA